MPKSLIEGEQAFHFPKSIENQLENAENDDQITLTVYLHAEDVRKFEFIMNARALKQKRTGRGSPVRVSWWMLEKIRREYQGLINASKGGKNQPEGEKEGSFPLPEEDEEPYF